jgi:hypothetical protein
VRPAVALALGLVLLAPAAVGAEPVERRLLRTIQIGTPQDLTVDEIVAFAKGDKADFLGHVLARSALLVLGRDAGFADWPVPRLLERVLNQLQRSSHAYHLPPEVPAGFGGEELVFTAVYALVVSGQADRAVDVLEQSVKSDNPFRRGVALQALRNIGSPRADAVIQGFADAGDDRNLAENLLADHHYPFLTGLHQRLPLLPPERRDRKTLVEAAREGCTERAALAVYFLGFFADGPDPAQAQAEQDLLRGLTRIGCFYTRFFAIRALALRSAESIGFWTALFEREKDAWQRAQLARIGFARFGRAFTAPALRLLAAEPVQYVQWELMHGNLEVRRGARLRDYWDLWLPTTLQFKLNFPDGGGSMEPEDLAEILAWLETGARPRNEWVRNHLLYGLAKHAAGRETRRLLRVFDAFADRGRHWWILAPLQDPGALPILRYWQGLPTEPSQREELIRLITLLEGNAAKENHRQRGACCLPTRACLLTWLEVTAEADVEIATEDEARTWLNEGGVDPAAAEVRFMDSLQRVAEVARRAGATPETWEHLYGCWRRTDTPRRGG